MPALQERVAMSGPVQLEKPCVTAAFFATAGASRRTACASRRSRRGGPAAGDAGARQLADAARTHQHRAGGREAGRCGRQHLDQPDAQGARRRAAAARAQGRAVRGVLRGLLQPQGRPLAVGPQGLLAGLRLRHRRQGRHRRHQQPRHRRRRRDHRQLPRRHQAESRKGDRQGHQDRPGAAQGVAEEGASRRHVRRIRGACGSATG